MIDINIGETIQQLYGVPIETLAERLDEFESVLILVPAPLSREHEGANLWMIVTVQLTDFQIFNKLYFSTHAEPVHCEGFCECDMVAKIEDKKDMLIYTQFITKPLKYTIMGIDTYILGYAVPPFTFWEMSSSISFDRIVKYVGNREYITLARNTDKFSYYLYNYFEGEQYAGILTLAALGLCGYAAARYAKYM